MMAFCLFTGQCVSAALLAINIMIQCLFFTIVTHVWRLFPVPLNSWSIYQHLSADIIDSAEFGHRVIHVHFS
ncbi:hypothetical protein BKA65DRAFT_27219 [Rhexocercosporidium sp. MPI-PUGE-AT-0058]|nr:hypothetical protein BKA65DRAFT_27219 [Rhexocercosporidium sp. MPI-PUGE-AT-0058]